jgi:hypothetical protein
MDNLGSRFLSENRGDTLAFGVILLPSKDHPVARFNPCRDFGKL